MSCREFVSLFLDAWLAGELPARRHQECTWHVTGCAACRSYTGGYRGVVAALDGLAATTDELPELDAELLRDVLAKRQSPRP